MESHRLCPRGCGQCTVASGAAISTEALLRFIVLCGATLVFPPHPEECATIYYLIQADTTPHPQSPTSSWTKSYLLNRSCSVHFFLSTLVLHCLGSSLFSPYFPASCLVCCQSCLSTNISPSGAESSNVDLTMSLLCLSHQ